MSADIYEQYDKIYRYCYFKVRNSVLAEDLTQETFLRYFEQTSYLERGRQMSYLYVIARNLCMDAFRRKKKEELTTELLEEIPCENPCEDTEQTLVLKQAISQLTYLRKRVFILSLLLILAGIVLSFQPHYDPQCNYIDKNCWLMSAILPFLALFSSVELTRSSSYKMAELEMSCRFCLQQLFAARILLLGGGNFAVLLTILLLLQRVSPFGFMRLALYLLTPYLLTSALCLILTSRFRGKEALYFCASASCGISTFNVFFTSASEVFYSTGQIGWWLLIMAFSLILIGFKLYQFIKQTEVTKWNLLLTE